MAVLLLLALGAAAVVAPRLSAMRRDLLNERAKQSLAAAVDAYIADRGRAPALNDVPARVLIQFLLATGHIGPDLPINPATGEPYDPESETTRDPIRYIADEKFESYHLLVDHE